MDALMRMAPSLPEPAALALARGVGGIAARVQPHRTLVMKSLRTAFAAERTEPELRKIAAGFYRHVTLAFFEIIRLGAWSRERLLESTELVGQEHMDSALQHGKGAIIIGGHTGNWEIGGAALGQRDYPLAVVSQPQRHGVLQDHLGRARQRHRVGVIPRSSLRDCYTCLRGGGVLGLLIDQRVKQGAVVVPFFGQPAATAPGPALLAMKTGAPVVLVAPRRAAGPSGAIHQIHIRPVEVAKTGDHEADVRENTARFQLAIETAIREAPEQWIWTNQRWNLKNVVPRGSGT